MDLSSLPQYPSPFQPATPAPDRTAGRKLSSPLAITLVCLVILLVVATTLYVFWPLIDAKEHPPTPGPMKPLDFKVIQQRFDQVGQTTRYEEVWQLLGPPSSREGLPDVEEMILYHPDRYPDDVKSRIWLRWTDPNDQEKWVTLLLFDNKVYLKYKNGF